ncbi:hypothetical protein N8T08_008259 [Aspergillus melleus]|uniref:Uncharacterized protein n=1 Tax=Aspergillus melleus TaxID=138277 RepID=A0ACC3AVY5_9EURO|nr:hypothetical protein N8T08_008259 [Aspergillus melleus]
MHSQTIVCSVIAVMSALAHAAPQQITKRSTVELSKTAQLKLADNSAERYKLLKDEDFLFKFGSDELPIATNGNFPALTGTGVSLSIGDLPGCSMSFIHLHPRATEIFSLSSGHILSQMVPEVAAVDSEGKQRTIRVELEPGTVTVYPAGSFHTQINPNCEPANFTAAFNSEEFAVGLVAKQTFLFSDDAIARTFGQSIAGEDIEKVRDAIPTDMALKVEQCLKKCGKEKRQA